MSDLRQYLDCPDIPAAEPRAVTNPPGSSRLDYRIADQSVFRQWMLDLLAAATIPDGPNQGDRPLADLAQQGLDDPAIALLDSWARVGDVLTFYQERIANEAFLATAGERLSLLQLARLVGYDLSPGVSAGAFLAFTVEDVDGSPASVVVPAGTPVQSIPGQDQLPQTFETEEDFTARRTLNALNPKQGRPQPLAGATSLLLSGIETGLAAGDRLLLTIEQETQLLDQVLARVQTVTADADNERTTITLEEAIAFDPAVATRSAQDVFADARLYALREQASFFGHNAVPYGSLPTSAVVKDDPYSEADPNADWDVGRTVWTDSKAIAYNDGSDLADEAPAVQLDRKVEDIATGGWAVIRGGTLVPVGGQAELGTGPVEWEAYRLSDVSDVTVADYALTAESTGLVLVTTAAGDDASGGGALGPVGERPQFDVRRSKAFLASEELTLAEQPIAEPYPSPVADLEPGLSSVTLSTSVADLRSGQPVILSGPLADGSGDGASVALIDRIDNSDPASTRLLFQQPLPEERFDRSQLTVNANVVRSTHGETVSDEVLGSGDSNVRNQTFTLDHTPLTFLSAARPGGIESTLVVRVDGVTWQQVDTLHDQDGDAQVYMVQIDDDGTTTVRFGDGSSGALLPTGQENVTAAYRTGIGLDGLVAAESLQLLTQRPLGISTVDNPLAAGGAAPPETPADARLNAPVTVRTAGGIVSLSDFEDFARTFAGIAKVKAAPLTGIHLTVAGVGGAAVDAGSLLSENLQEAIGAARLPGPPLLVDSYDRLGVKVEAALVIDARFRPATVLEEAAALVADAFSFDRRQLAEPLYASDVVEVLQSHPAVVAVDLDLLYIADSDQPGLTPRLEARPARAAAGRIRPAQLLLIEEADITLRERTP